MMGTDRPGPGAVGVEDQPTLPVHMRGGRWRPSPVVDARPANIARRGSSRRTIALLVLALMVLGGVAFASTGGLGIGSDADTDPQYHDGRHAEATRLPSRVTPYAVGPGANDLGHGIALATGRDVGPSGNDADEARGSGSGSGGGGTRSGGGGGGGGGLGEGGGGSGGGSGGSSGGSGAPGSLAGAGSGGGSGGGSGVGGGGSGGGSSDGGGQGSGGGQGGGGAH